MEHCIGKEHTSARLLKGQPFHDQLNFPSKLTNDAMYPGSNEVY